MPKTTKFLARAAACLSLLMHLSAGHAYLIGEGDRGTVQIGPYVYHFVDNTDHNQWPRLFGLEYESGSHWLVGGVVFRNSYYQDATYIYGGKRWFVDAPDNHVYLKLTAGPVYGYKPPYDDKLPINHDGFGFGVAPALGYQFKRASVQLVAPGFSVIAITFGYDLWN